MKFYEKTSLFGLPKEKSWVLLANAYDPTLLRNDIAFELGRRLGVPFANTSHHVELFLNGKYLGNYQLTEQIQVKKNRIDIDEEKDFLVELDTYFDEEWKFKSSILGLPIMIKSPEITQASQMDFVIKAMQDMENSLFSSDFPNNNYNEFIDINLLINYLLLNELARNEELYHPKSVYLHKKVDEKICFGPIWDYDFALYYSSNYPRIFPTSKDGIGAAFFSRFFEDPEFCKMYKKRWNEVKAQLSDINIYIDRKLSTLQRSQEENYKIWKIDRDYNEEVNSLKNGLMDFMDYLDKEINKN